MAEENYDWMADVDLDDIVDMKTVPNGTEAEVEILGIQTGTGDNGPWLMAIMRIAGEDFAKDISYFVPIPGASDDARQRNTNKTRLRAFFKAFSLEGEDRNDPTGWVGLVGRAILGEKDKGDEYGAQNMIRRFV